MKNLLISLLAFVTSSNFASASYYCDGNETVTKLKNSNGVTQVTFKYFYGYLNAEAHCKCYMKDLVKNDLRCTENSNRAYLVNSEGKKLRTFTWAPGELNARVQCRNSLGIEGPYHCNYQ